jgi:hypothetical protein
MKPAAHEREQKSGTVRHPALPEMHVPAGYER